MSDNKELTNTSVAVKTNNLIQHSAANKIFSDHIYLAVSTFGVGYIPLAPGTWGSAVGILIYLLFRRFEQIATVNFLPHGWTDLQITAWIHFVNAVIFTLFCLLSIWASGHAAKILADKDPQKVVVDEVIGQLLVFLFVPFEISWWIILSGFVLFRLFDIWKPYPIDSLQNLPAGIGICADDILAGVYGGICLAIIYAISITI